MKKRIPFIILFVSILFIQMGKAQHEKTVLFSGNANNSNQFAKFQNNSLNPGERTMQMQPAEPAYDSSYYWVWDKTSNSWPYYFKNLYTYDSKKNLLKDNTFQYSGSVWKNYASQICSYDKNDDRDTVWSMDANNAIREMSTTTYNLDKTELIWFYWNVKNGKLGYNLKSIGNYDTLGNELSTIVFGWREADSTWGNVNRYICHYNPADKLTEKTIEYWNGKWGFIKRYVYTYDAKGNNDSILYQEGNGTVWNMKAQTINTYNSKNELEIAASRYRDFSGTWIDEGKKYYSYYPGSFKKAVVTKYYDKTLKDTVNSDSTYYYLSGSPAHINEYAHHSQLTIYPNPSSGRFTIKTESKQPIRKIEVYNLLGIKIREQTSGEIILDNEAKGLYMITVFDGKEVYQSKILVE